MRSAESVQAVDRQKEEESEKGERELDESDCMAVDIRLFGLDYDYYVLLKVNVIM